MLMMKRWYETYAFRKDVCEEEPQSNVDFFLFYHQLSKTVEIKNSNSNDRTQDRTGDVMRVKHMP